MSQRWTKADHDRFRRDWLLERMGHAWGDTFDGPTRCVRCGAKYGPANVRRFCPKRTRKPNRWRLHYRRAELAAMYPREKKVVRNAEWIFGQLQEIAREVRRDPRFVEDQRYWKYHRLARRYRRLLREWWALPSVEVQKILLQQSNTRFDRDDFGADLTRRRNKLLKRVQETQQRTIRDGGCTYTFRAEAQWNGRPLFVDEEIAS